MYIYIYIYVCVLRADRPPTYNLTGRLFKCSRVGETDAGGSARPTERRLLLINLINYYASMRPA